MLQGNLFQSTEVPVLSVTQLNHYLRQLLESDELLQKIWVEGEVSNVSRPRSGHIYFTLKDQKAALNCVIWRSSAERLLNLPENGAAIEARGYLSVYEQGGRYQLYVDQVRISGEGQLYQQFMELKVRLEAEGLFDEILKRPIPAAPKTIGIVTSATSAAVQDMLNTINQRYPLAEVVIAPTAVQGNSAPQQIIRGIQTLNETIHPDVILVGRGGGSLEDLWCFNDEGVVRAIALSEAPVISGVGHETDFTLSDFAADLRAPTPTGAAVLATPDIVELFETIHSKSTYLTGLMNGIFEVEKNNFQTLQSGLKMLSPEFMIQSEIQHVDDLNRHLERNVQIYWEKQKENILNLTHRLNALNPISILERGYAIVENNQQQIVNSVSDLAVNDPINIRLKDGNLKAEVTQTNKNV